MFETATINFQTQANSTKSKGVVEEVEVYVGASEERFAAFSAVTKRVARVEPHKIPQEVTEVRVGDVS